MMKRVNIKILSALIYLMSVLVLNSCKKEIKYEETRLFRPVLSKPLASVNNTIVVTMGRLKSAVAYRVELSRDNFKTPPIKTITDTSSVVTFKNLLWNTIYQVRAKAFAADTLLNSKLADLGPVKTERFPSILSIPAGEDIIDIGLNVRWAISGEAVTNVKIFAATDEELLSPLANYPTTSSEQLAGLKVIKKLLANTSYTVAVYSNSVLRGFETFTTKPPLPTVGNVIDLRGVNVPNPDDGSFLFDQLTNAAPGSTVLLDGDQSYAMKTFTFDKALTLKSGYSLTSGGATIDFTNSGQFEIGVNANISSIVIDGIRFLGTTSKYVINAGLAINANVAQLTFINSTFISFRNLIRTRSQWINGAITQVTVDNCVFSDFSNAGLVAVDAGANNTLPSVIFKNSTFWKVQKLVNNRATRNSVVLTITDCTFSESPRNGNLIEYTTTTNLTGGLSISNTIFGRGADNGASPPSYNNPLVNTGNLASTVITFSNTYKTNDFSFTSPAAVNNTYSGTILDLWEDPLNGNFKFKDKSFAGKSTAGAPRWRQ